ncbi:MAG: tetratricopeptide repeat protein [Thermoguttaceae bacterium]
MASPDDSDQNEQQPPEKAEKPDKPEKRWPPSAAAKKRLQKCFETANQKMAQENFDYATELFRQCVWGDPGNRAFVQNFLGNLQKKYANNRKGSSLAKFKELGARSAIKKALGQSEWEEVVKNSLVVLKVNPWDVPALTAMATASENLAGMIPGEYIDCQWLYLRTAAEANPKDPDVCRACAMYLGKRGQYDQAINFWHRVEQARPDDEEPRRAIATLAVEKTLKFDESDPNKISARDRHAPAAQAGGEELSPMERLRRRIARDPVDILAYYELAQIYFNEDKYQEAEDVMHEAYEASKHDSDVRDKWDDARVRHVRHKCVLAERRAKAADSDEARAEVKQLNRQLNELLLEIYQGRVERYPANLAFHFELGQQYKVLGQFGEAIKAFQNARNDARRKGVCMLYLGECFQAIKQYRLAMDHYESAIQEIPDRDFDNKKLGLYRAGKLALALKDLGKAEKNLGVLASMDFSYRDVSTLLDKVAASRDDEEGKGRGKDDRKDKGNNKDKGDEDQSDREDEPDGDDTNS